jgi:hypothetical protein
VTTNTLLATMRTTLINAQHERPKREDFVDGELGWVTYERTVMLNAVNTARSERGLPPVTVTEIERVEQQAVGHSDYTQKFALYCSELARGEQP